MIKFHVTNQYSIFLYQPRFLRIPWKYNYLRMILYFSQDAMKHQLIFSMLKQKKKKKKKNTQDFFPLEV